jgi:CheY-like chemotaxis protein
MSLIINKKIVSHGLLGTAPKFIPLRVLVVDDDHSNKLIVSQLIESFGYQVDSANGGLEALHRLKHSEYDVVVTDLQMPDFDGYALASWLKHKMKDTKVIIMTACCGEEVDHYKNTGIVDYWMFKPFNMDTLDNTLREATLMGNY